jgi:hypothetical protein
VDLAVEVEVVAPLVDVVVTSAYCDVTICQLRHNMSEEEWGWLSGYCGASSAR